MAAPLGRVGRVLRRRRLDGRLPEPTARLLRDLVKLELRSTVSRFTAVVRAPLPGATIALAPGEPPPGRWHRWRADEPLEVSLTELSHQLARPVLAQFERADLDPFLIEHDRHHVHIGLMSDDRRAALGALRNLGGPFNWYIDSRRGHRWSLHEVHDVGARRALRSESWRVFRCVSLGPELVAGPPQAVEISFWTPGSDGRVERLGFRGLHRMERDTERTVESVDGYDYPGLAAFPVGRSLSRFREPIDVVYTWVDGEDPVWSSSLAKWKRDEGADRRGDHAAHSSRYTSHDELRYSLRSVWLNAGWVRRIYVVTADQVPDWLIEDDRLRIVSHREILPPEALPTFNSHAIESRLHHIEGLAEHFIYFNDDMFLGRAVTPEQFFTPNGLSRFFESEARVPTSSGRPDLAVDTAARRGQRLIDEEFGTVVTHKLHHAPYSLRRSAMTEVEQRYPTVVRATTARRFRHPEDLSIPSAFAHHYGFVTGRAVPGHLHIGYENLGSRNLTLFLRRALLGRDFDAFCINETERWETDPELATAQVMTFFERYFPVRSPWERHAR